MQASRAVFPGAARTAQVLIHVDLAVSHGTSRFPDSPAARWPGLVPCIPFVVLLVLALQIFIVGQVAAVTCLGAKCSRSLIRRALTSHGTNEELMCDGIFLHVHAALAARSSPKSDLNLDIDVVKHRHFSGASATPGYVFETFEGVNPVGVSPESIEDPHLLASVALQDTSLSGVSVNVCEGCHGVHFSEPK